MSTLITQPFVRRLLANPAFFTEFPEFSALQPLVAARPNQVAPCSGCTGARATEERLVGAFVNILRSLGDNRQVQLKKKAGATTFQFNAFNRLRQTTEVMIL